jgi:hypothetical protein
VILSWGSTKSVVGGDVRSTENGHRLADMDGVERTDDGEEAHVKITRQNAEREIPEETL